MFSSEFFSSSSWNNFGLSNFLVCSGNLDGFWKLNNQLSVVLSSFTPPNFFQSNLQLKIVEAWPRSFASRVSCSSGCVIHKLQVKKKKGKKYCGWVTVAINNK